jgi:hypothetical protein
VHIGAVEDPLVWIAQGEIRVEQPGAFAKVHHAAIGIEISGDVGDPAIAYFEAAFEPAFAGRLGSRCWRDSFLGFRLIGGLGDWLGRFGCLLGRS